MRFYADDYDFRWSGRGEMLLDGGDPHRKGSFVSMFDGIGNA
jgi:hypothetical protein